MPEALLWVYAGLVGAAVGSFLNVCIFRLPEGESVIRPRSRCPACETPIRARDNIPVLGWLLLRGRCRTCSARISIQYPLVELTTALLWIAAAARYGATWQALSTAVFFTLLLGIALTDARTQLIPAPFTNVGIVLGFLFSLAPGGINPLQSALGGLTGFGILLLVGFGVGNYLVWRGRIESSEDALGGGDLWMMGFVGTFLGPQGVFLTIFFGSVLGILIWIPIQAVTGQERLPFGVFLALGAALIHSWGAVLGNWYVRSVAALWGISG